MLKPKGCSTKMLIAGCSKVFTLSMRQTEPQSVTLSVSLFSVTVYHSREHGYPLLSVLEAAPCSRTWAWEENAAETDTAWHLKVEFCSLVEMCPRDNWAWWWWSWGGRGGENGNVSFSSCIPDTDTEFLPLRLIHLVPPPQWQEVKLQP